MQALPKLAADSVEAIITDPPYGLGFMGKDWDAPGGVGAHPMRRTIQANTVNTGVARQGGRQRSGAGFVKRQARDAASFQVWSESWAREALRVLKPGGHLLAFGGTRTFHRLTCALEDAGFEIRDCLCWLYGSGFPKSLNVSKAIDDAAGAKREVIGTYIGATNIARQANTGKFARYEPGAKFDPEDRRVEVTRPATPEASKWNGWGTALKPAWEPIILARKPVSGTVAANVLAHGTGAINIDGCRIRFRCPADERASKNKNRHAEFSSTPRKNRIYGVDERARGNYDAPGRWPANVALTHAENCRRTGYTQIRASGHHPAARGSGGLGTSGHKGQRHLAERSNASELVHQWECAPGCPVRMLDCASRFFYCAKASRAEREAGLGGLDQAITNDGRRTTIDNPYQRGATLRHNVHPTVKPIALMRWLVRLVTPPGGTVLDPFAGSGSTGIAAVIEGARFLGIERDAEYTAIARARIRHWAPRAATATHAAPARKAT